MANPGIRSAAAVVALALGAGSARSQNSPGDLFVVGDSTSSFAVVSPAGVATTFSIGSFLPSGTAHSFCVLWDPWRPSDVLIGGEGFVGRITWAGNLPSWSLITTQVGIVNRMAWEPGGTLVLADTVLLRLDPVSGSVSLIGALPPAAQAWSAYGLAVHPITGDIYIGTWGTCARIWRYDGSAFTPFINNLGCGDGGIVSTLEFAPDPIAGASTPTLLCIRTVILGLGLNTALMRISAAAGITGLATFAPYPSLRGLAAEPGGTILLGSTAGQVLRVPAAGGAPAPFATALGIGTVVTGLSLAGMTYGGAAPFTANVTTIGAGDVFYSLDNIPLGTSEGWTFVTTTTPTPPGQGPTFGITPDAVTYQLPVWFPTALPGNPIHWPVAAPGLFPAVPFIAAPGAMASSIGQTWDIVAIALDTAGRLRGASRVARVSW